MASTGEVKTEIFLTVYEKPDSFDETRASASINAAGVPDLLESEFSKQKKKEM